MKKGRKQKGEISMGARHLLVTLSATATEAHGSRDKNTRHLVPAASVIGLGTVGIVVTVVTATGLRGKMQRSLSILRLLGLNLLLSSIAPLSRISHTLGIR